MAGSYVQALGSATTKAGTTTQVVTLSAAPTVGNSVIVAAASSSNIVIASVADSAGNTYAVDRTQVNSTTVTVSVASTHAIASVPTTVTVTWSSATSAIHVVSVIEVAGLASASTRDQVQSGTGATTSVSSGATPTTTQADEFLIGAVGQHSTSATMETFTAGTSWTAPAAARVATSGGSNNRAINLEWQVVSTTGAYTATGTTGAAFAYAAAIVTYKAAATSSPGTLPVTSATAPATAPAVTFTAAATATLAATVASAAAAGQLTGAATFPVAPAIATASGGAVDLRGEVTLAGTLLVTPAPAVAAGGSVAVSAGAMFGLDAAMATAAVAATLAGAERGDLDADLLVGRVMTADLGAAPVLSATLLATSAITTNLEAA